MNKKLKYPGVVALLVFMLAASVFGQLEDAYRANNRGVSLLEQFKFDDAEKEFRDALAKRPGLRLAEVNLTIALFNAKKFDDAKQLAASILKTEPKQPQINYILGLIARAEDRPDDALAAFQNVIEFDPADVGANVNCGQIYALRREYASAIKYLEVAYASEPFNLTAIYNLATSLQRSGERARAAELLKRFQVLRDTSAGVNIGLNYLEQGFYAEALESTGAETELVDKREPNVRFTEVPSGINNKSNLMPAKRILVSRGFRTTLYSEAVIDFDGDGAPDIARIDNNIEYPDTSGKRKNNSSENSVRGIKSCRISLYRNSGGKFVDVSDSAGDLSKAFDFNYINIVAGDLDNDNLPDLVISGSDGLRIFHNNGNAGFREIKSETKGPMFEVLSLTTVLADYDHDGDLDIFMGGFQMMDGDGFGPSVLLRNNNDLTFTNVTEESKIGVAAGLTVAVVPTDVNNRRDLDFVVANHNGKISFLSNQRDDTFADEAPKLKLEKKGAWNTIAAGDVNKDGFTDYFFGSSTVGQSFFAVSNGKGGFNQKPAPKGLKAISAAQFLDYDNDGLLDLLVATKKGLLISRNLGANGFAAASSKPFPVSKNFADALRILSADFDGDGDLDLLIDGHLLRNNATNRGATVRLQGRVSNKSGVGARVVMRAGSLSQQVESYAANPMPAPSEIHFGLGKRTAFDSLRILWSSGIVQSETQFDAASKTSFKLTEVDRKPASCPYLYVWNGERFEFVTDFLGGGEMANWAGKGEFHYPDSDEFVRIAPGSLKPKDGFYELRVTNELEEVMYLDHLKLVAVAHDADVAVYPNEGLGRSEQTPEKFVAVKNERTPRAALNSDGVDVTAKIATADRVFYDDFKKLPQRGYAAPHSLTIDLGDDVSERSMLLLTGWTDYAFSSDNVAASQRGESLTMPSLQVEDANGEWKTVIESIGIPVGRPQTLPVDLTGKFLSKSRKVRIVTNFRTYWDKVTVGEIVDLKPETTELKPETAELRERGFSKETRFGAMIVPDYDQVSTESPWKNFAGRFTGTGDVRSLLDSIDDVFVIARAGDEFALRFRELPALPKGRSYTFMLFADGYSKEMDPNSGSPENVWPLPFKKMTNYPYGASEIFPMTEEKRRIYDETLTRFSRGGWRR